MNPNKSQTSHMESINDHILEILNLSKFTKRKELRSQLISRGFFITDRKLRLAVEKLITEDHYGISSSELGYSLIRTKDDLDEAVSYLEKKSSAIAIRRNCLLRNFAERKLDNQIQIFV